jgi:hypothetical protein
VRDKHWQTKPGGLDWQAIHSEYRPRVEKSASPAEAAPSSKCSDVWGRTLRDSATICSIVDDEEGGPGVRH